MQVDPFSHGMIAVVIARQKNNNIQTVWNL